MLQVQPEATLQVKQETELERKRRELKEAIESQNFEEAAKLRDEIKVLEEQEK